MSQVYLARLSIAGITREKVPLLIYPGSILHVLSLSAEGLALVEVDGTQVEVLVSDLEDLATPVSDSGGTTVTDT